TKACPIGATCNLAKNIYTVQFHPEVVHSEYGNDLLDNFVKLCGIKDTWSMEDFVDMCIAEVREQVGTKNVFLMVSGGVDSSVVFALLNKALGKERVFGMFVDTGLLRYEEAVEVQEFLQNAGFDNLHTAYESERFLGELKEQYDPEVKRGIIGNAFLDVQRDVSSDLNLNPDDWYLAQGTIFPDTIETGGSKHSVKIKTHHNRVEQIQRLIEQGKLVEPLKMLFKDEVRQVARLLNLPEKMIERHPFPGPGLGVRILCAQGGDVEVRAGELEGVFEDRYGYGFRLLPIRSVGVQGDFRTFAHPVAIFTDEFDRSKLAEIATEIPNNHREINRVILCLSSENKEDFEVRPSHIDTNRVEKLQLADKITMDIIREAGLYNKIWQFPVVLAPVFNSQGESIILRPIESTDAMTAVSSDIPFGILRQIGDEILERVDGIGSVFYDLTSKPPATIEWE
ncbi:MAG: glutamine-hydrolyzing GMP synthase, partial [Candidatus Gracilibacteria bacterium]|nr:glutamine-hydrolyzing GMP synthase [Candidatus Gracilibacteria bacterium]